MSDPLIDVRVARKQAVAEDIASFELVSAEGKPLPAFDAGAHLDVHIPKAPVRQYSLCNPPGETHRYLIGVLRDPATRGGSIAMHDAVREGTVLQISEPKNHFKLDETAKTSWLLAGGIGITPLLAMAERLSAIGADFELHYCTRSVARTAFKERIETSPYASRVAFHHDDGPPEQKFDILQKLATPQPDVHLYVCGPSGFMDAVIATARDRGWDEHRIHFEYFAGVNAHSADDKSFEVEIASTKKVYRIEAAQTIVEALAAQGVDIPTSCEQGVCGTCLTQVLAGEPDHKDLYLTPEEQALNDQMLPCCSRAKSKRLVLDL